MSVTVAAVAVLLLPALAHAAQRSGALTGTDPNQTGRLTRNGVTSTCAAPKANPGLATATGSRHYDAYTFRNNTTSSACVHVTLDPLTCNTDLLFVAAYGGSFDPAHPENNWLADPGASPLGAPITFSFTVAPGATFVIVVSEVSPDTTCAGYTLSEDVPTAQNPATITIPDSGPATPYSSDITVSGVSGSVGKVTVTFNRLNHTFPADIDALLVAPSGQKVLLMSDQGGGTDAVNADLVFDDAAANPLPAAIVSGTFKPTVDASPDSFPAPAPAGPYATTLGGFAGGNPNGTWRLFILDDAAGDSGSIAGWSLAIKAIPETTITAGPGNLTNDSTPTFTFSSTGEGSTFQCHFDGAVFTPCSSPFTSPALSNGAHVFFVRSTDQFGFTDGTPATRTFTVDTLPPETTIVSGPPASTSARKASFTFSSEPGATFQCERDGGAFAACTSPTAYAALALGMHTFAVRAIDAAGNIDQSPAQRSWKVVLPPCVVPKVVGKTLKKAKARIRKAHCRVGKITKKPSTKKKKGRVLKQKPKPGKRLKPNAKVNLTVGKGGL